MSLQVDLRSVVHALSDALDLVGINDVHHGKRVGIMAVEILRARGAGKAELDMIFDAGLLHDIGVSSTDLHCRLVNEFDWEGSRNHAEHGARLLTSFPPLAGLAPVILEHHTHWSRLKDNYSPALRHANLIFLTDRIDVLAAVAMLKDQLLDQVPEIRRLIAAQAGEMFDPELVDAFLEVSRKEAFWLALEADAVRDYMEEVSRHARQSGTDMETLRGVASLFANVVDAKSRFTVEHSEGVARVAHYLGEHYGLDAESCGKMEIAGHLHDLGKLRIPDALLEKKGPLDDAERRQMASHAYETYRILSRIPGFEDIAKWASFHHEIPDGEGYPFRLKGADLPIQARLLRAADIFQALAQDRPYRTSLPADQVLGYLNELTAAGKLDEPIYQLVANHLQDIYRLARPHAEDSGPTGA